MLKQLKDSGKCHNDIKPGNLLFNKVQTASGFDVDLRLGDFGLCDKLGGTPGWSPADFTNKREPGVSDLYSVGLVTLYLLCEDEELFYAIRDNYVPFSSTLQPWLTKFRNSPALRLICQMIEPLLNNKFDLDDCEKQWSNMKIKVITRACLVGRCKVPSEYLNL